MKDFFKKVVTLSLQLEARAVLRKYAPQVVAITGSVGKTATKDAIFSVIAKIAHTRKSEKSFNSEVGLPLTILGRPNAWSNPLKWFENIFDGLFLIFIRTRYPKWLVLEVGADRPGDITQVVKWLPVDIAVITRLPEVPVHVEFFDSPEEVVEEKASLIKALTKEGVLVLYGDDARTRSLARRAEGRRVVTFGFGEENNVRARGVEIVFEEGEHPRPLGIRAELTVHTESAPIEVVGTVGEHALLPLLAGAAVGHALNMEFPQILEALKSYEPPHGRMHLLPGIKQTTIIDDTYNSSPAAVVAALDALAAVGNKRKVAILGDMLELGRYSAAEHKKVGAYAAEHADLLVTVGFRARDIAEGALNNSMEEGKVLQYEDARRAGAELQNILEEGDTILIKGSQSMRMERTVKEVMLEPERAKKLLVRQDVEWQRR
jgi:UDP-N-acetylmuramoyl-tripeptide--D-alanyl-D-alanine ligase